MVVTSPSPAAAEVAHAQAPLLLAATSGTVVTLHDTSTGAALRRLAAGRDGLLNALAFSPCGRCLLAAGSLEVARLRAAHPSTCTPSPSPSNKSLKDARGCTSSVISQVSVAVNLLGEEVPR